MTRSSVVIAEQTTCAGMSSGLRGTVVVFGLITCMWRSFRQSARQSDTSKKLNPGRKRGSKLATSPVTVPAPPRRITFTDGSAARLYKACSSPMFFLDASSAFPGASSFHGELPLPCNCRQRHPLISGLRTRAFRVLIHLHWRSLCQLHGRSRLTRSRHPRSVLLNKDAFTRDFTCTPIQDGCSLRYSR